MRSYKILIIAWHASINHISEFIRNLKKTNPNVEISLLSSRPGLDAIPDDVKENATDITCVKYYSGRIKNRRFARLVDRFYFVQAFARLSKGKYDIVNIHFAKPRLAYVLRWLRKMSSPIVISPWGSDVLRLENENSIRNLAKVYSLAYYVTVGKGSQIGKQLVEKIGVDSRKLVELGWGGDFFDFIQENAINVTMADAKERFGLSDRYVITCGYNSQPEQRHEFIINTINSIKKQLPENLTLLLPYTYSRTAERDSYIESLVKKGKALGLDVISIKEHLNMPDLLKLRMATDIFVHIQTTDAGSRCVMEYVACNKKIVHGSWMKYAYLEEFQPSCYFPVNRLEELGGCIVKAYNTEISDLPTEVKEIIKKRGWRYKMTLWNEFFESLIS